ncbi:GtrA family protein [Spirosoma radiotolerans]|uniref:GtrA family protein n=1 Tax=Spirosoma radiotolerans TaxID=1379870 RepID=A0A0E3V8K3_9BACT|nr:GtrA family protein [Spirosoma radiotolerans]AKD56827.1 GtrA family protein [Spirosoma radiotolerans]
MQTFFKAQLTSLIASGVDFLTTIACVSLVHFWYLSASVIGAIGGGVVSFGLSKAWVFAQSNQPVGLQLSRFVLVWFGNAGLNAAGLFVATQFMGIQYLVAKTGVAILVGVSYNYFFQRDFVFSLS